MKAALIRVGAMAGLLSLLAGGLILGGVGPAGATPADTSLNGLWRSSSDHPFYRNLLRISGSFTGGFTISAAESFTMWDCPVPVGQTLMQLSPTGSASPTGPNTYAAMGMKFTKPQGKCTFELEKVPAITATYSSPSTIRTNGAPGTLSRVSAPPATSTTRSTTTKPKPPPPKPPPKPEETWVKLKLDYWLPDRSGLVQKNGLVKYYTTREEIDPPSWTANVVVRWPGGGDCRGGTYTWTVGGVPNRFVQRTDPGNACTFSFGGFRELNKEYRVNVRATQGDRHGVGEIRLKIKDYLIVGLGDSMGSGEGNPDVPGQYGPYGQTPAAKGSYPATWKEPRCHLSASSFEAKVAAALEGKEGESRKASVTLLHLACSGATIQTGMLHRYGGVVEGKGKFEAQVTNMAKLVGRRKVDAVLLSIGVNDVGFSKVVNFCLDDGALNFRQWGTIDCWKKTYVAGVTLRGWVRSNLARLSGDYARLAQALSDAGVSPGQVYIAEYPNPTRDANGRTCDPLMTVKSPVANGWFSRTEAAKAESELLIKLNSAVHSAAGVGWHFVQGAMQLSRTHGYCTGDKTWFVGLRESLEHQGDKYGALHPNRAAHEAIAGLFVAELRKNGIDGLPH